MRQRRVKNEKEKVLSYSGILVTEPETYKGRWQHFFNNDSEIHIEIGSGKGKFITSLAENNPGINYIAIEPIGSILLRVLEKAEAKNLPNIACAWKFADDICEYIGENEISRIYLNFSDPWPKARHAKRRLTHRNFLQAYKHILKPKGIIQLKTDNIDLFNFSLEEFKVCGFQLEDITNDLHQENAENITTEYEEKFMNWGMKINYCKAILI